MKVILPDYPINYDGSQISSLWAYQEFGVQEDSLVGFRGGCEIKDIHMVDLEDRKAGDRIFSPDMLHIIVEHFDTTDLKLIYSRQRLLVVKAQEELMQKGYRIDRVGDDLFFDGTKLTISIASTSCVSSKIHFGINVKCEDYMSLEKMGFNDPEGLLKKICEKYKAELEDIERDLRKSRKLDVI